MAEPDHSYISMLAGALTEECKRKKAIRIFFDYIHNYYFVPEEACRKYLEAAAAKAGMEIRGRNEEMAVLAKLQL